MHTPSHTLSSTHTQTDTDDRIPNEDEDDVQHSATQPKWKKVLNATDTERRRFAALQKEKNERPIVTPAIVIEWDENSDGVRDLKMRTLCAS